MWNVRLPTVGPYMYVSLKWSDPICSVRLPMVGSYMEREVTHSRTPYTM